MRFREVYPDPDDLTPEDLQELLTDARAGDAEALGDLLDEFDDYLAGKVRYRLPREYRRKVDPADVVQETFLAACRAFPAFAGQTLPSFRAWLRALLWHTFYRVLRSFRDCQKRGAEPGVPFHPEARGGVPDREPVAPTAEPCEQLIEHETTVALRAAIDELPAPSREALCLRYGEELPCADIGAILRRSAEAARKLCERGCERLAAALS